MIMACGIMVCAICDTEHRYKNPSQFSAWIRRHRAKAHPEVEGRIRFLKKAPRQTKEWKEFGERPPCNPRVMLKLPDLRNGTDIYLDRRTGIIWRHLVHYERWSYYNPPRKHGRTRVRTASVR